MERVLVTVVLVSMLPWSEADPPCGGVFCTPDIEIEDCEGDCATLYFYDSQKMLIHYEAGTVERIQKIDNKWGVRDAVYVRQVGTGCYNIHNRARHGGEQLQLRGQEVIDLKILGWNQAIK